MNNPLHHPVELNCLTTLRELRGGEFIHELDERLRQVTEDVSERGKSGSVTIKLTVTASGRSLEIDDEITSRTPKVAKPGTLFFRDREGLLTRNDPKQHELPFRIEHVTPAQLPDVREGVVVSLNA